MLSVLLRTAQLFLSRASHAFSIGILDAEWDLGVGENLLCSKYHNASGCSSIRLLLHLDGNYDFEDSILLNNIC